MKPQLKLGISQHLSLTPQLKQAIQQSTQPRTPPIKKALKKTAHPLAPIPGTPERLPVRAQAAVEASGRVAELGNVVVEAGVTRKALNAYIKD